MASHAASGASDIPDSTTLALDRTRLAHERTLMAWIRTATSLISFGFTIYKFFQYLREQGQAERSDRLFGPREFALLMISTGLVALLVSTLQHWKYMRELREQTHEATYSLATVIAALISILGIFALIAVFLRQ